MGRARGRGVRGGGALAMSILTGLLGQLGDDAPEQRLLREARERWYRLPEGFAGFRVGVCCADEIGVHHGHLKAVSPYSLILRGLGEAEEKARDEISVQLANLWPLPSRLAEGRRLVWRGEEGVSRIVEEVDGLGSTYRIDGDIHTIERVVGGMRVLLEIQSEAKIEDGRALPSRFSVSYRDCGDGALLRTDSYRDTYLRVEDVYLPASRCVVIACGQGGISLRRLRLWGHELL